MAFGRPTRYLQVDLNRIPTTSNDIRNIWDRSVEEASDQYKKRMVFNSISIFQKELFRLFLFFSTIYVVIIVIRMLQEH